MSNQKLFDLHDVAELLNTTPHAIKKLILEDAIRAYRVGREFRIHPMDLLAFLKANCTQQNDDDLDLDRIDTTETID